MTPSINMYARPLALVIIQRCEITTGSSYNLLIINSMSTSFIVAYHYDKNCCFYFLFNETVWYKSHACVLHSCIKQSISYNMFLSYLTRNKRWPFYVLSGNSWKTAMIKYRGENRFHVGSKFLKEWDLYASNLTISIMNVGACWKH